MRRSGAMSTDLTSSFPSSNASALPLTSKLSKPHKTTLPLRAIHVKESIWQHSGTP